MKTAYPTAAEAHPNLNRPEDSQMALALLRAMQKAAKQGMLRIEVPEPLRGRIRVGGRHCFNKE